jgi:nicotinamidase-related amidase
VEPLNIEQLDPSRTALITLDCQVAVFEGYVPGSDVPARMAEALGAARAAGMMVIHVGVRFRPGHPEVSERNTSFARFKGTEAFVEGSAGIEFHPDVTPLDGEFVIYKQRVGAFATQLDSILRANDIDVLVLGGVVTSGVVLSTVRAASDLEYRLIVLSDGCADPDEDLNRILMERVFPRQASVVTVDDFTHPIASRSRS